MTRIKALLAEKRMTDGVSVGIKILGLGLLVYWPVLGFDFINLDDPYLVQNNAGLLHSDPASLLFSPVAGLYHPLTNLTFWLDLKLGGLRPGFMHGTNLAWHIFGALCLYLWMRDLLGSVVAALILALGFLLHPTHVESVAWISERKDVVSAPFFFLALWAFGRERWWMGVVLAALSLMAKPFAVSLPALVILNFWFRLGRKEALERLRTKKALAAGSMLVLICIWAAFAALQSQQQVRLESTETWLDAISRWPGQVAFYFAQFLWPHDLRVVYTVADLEITWTRILLLLGWWIPTLTLVRRSRSFGRETILGLAIFFITMIPMFKWIPYGDSSPVSDRYLYVSFLGLMLPWASWLGKQTGWLSKAALFIMLGGWTMGTMARLPDWQDAKSLWLSQLKVDPDSKEANENLGRYYIGLRDSENALRYLNKGHIKKWDNLANRALAHMHRKEMILADQLLRQAESTHGEHPLILNLRAQWFMESGKLEEAKGTFAKSLLAESHLDNTLLKAEAYSNMGVIAFRQNQLEECKRLQGESLRVLPGYVYGVYNLALCQFNSGDTASAEAGYRRTLEIQAHFPMAYNGLGVIAFQAGRFSEAVSYFRQALAQDPNLAIAQQNLKLAEERLKAPIR